MVPLSMTLSDLWPGFQGHYIFWSLISEKLSFSLSLKDKVTTGYCSTGKVPNIWNGPMFGDLDWPLNASSGFVIISWASCFIYATKSRISVSGVQKQMKYTVVFRVGRCFSLDFLLSTFWLAMSVAQQQTKMRSFSFSRQMAPASHYMNARRSAYYARAISHYPTGQGHIYWWSGHTPLVL